jgi:hypothetical protein
MEQELEPSLALKTYFLGKVKLGMIQRRTRPRFSKDDEERLLAYMQVTRHLSINYAAAYGYHSPQYALQTSLNDP